MKLIVGLGNPGDKYEYTYHNVGWLALDVLADRLGIRLSNKECDSLTGVKSVGGEKIILAKPLTFMNLSGNAVKQLLGRYKAQPSELIVVYDDIDIEKGTFRYRVKGSAGTHNGMRDIIAKIGTENFERVRIGTGRLPENVPLISYVLMTIPDTERAIVAQGVKDGVSKIMELLG
ncbi:MAG: aminoacyl-tRNA hydrolase [Clostridia bacterium]|nr:aminoacyl-tRNA hydrolase [Clostridia bacterium]